MIALNHLQLAFGGRAILKDVHLNIREGECIAVVGPNGCGKSTLLRVIAGIEKPDKGEVRLPNKFTIGYLPQEADLSATHSLREELLTAYNEVREALAEMQELEHQMGELDHQSAEYARVLERYSECTHFIEHRDGYALEAQVGRVSSGLGFSASDLDRPCGEFSGGWQMRVLLAKLILRKPDVLLMDEPTNHLDLETTLWLEDWIKTCGRTVVLVSHERATMDRLADRIICMEHGCADTYTGGYTRYLEQSKAKRDALWEAYEKQSKEIEAMEGFIRRFRYTASRAALVQSRIKQLDKIERIEPPFHPTAIHFKFPDAPPSYREVITLNHLGHAYGEHQVFSGADLIIQRGDRVGLVGVNGAGKSTLLRIIAGREQPAEGSCVIGGKAQMAYFAQYDAATLSSNETLLQAIEANAPMQEAHRSRDLLGAFLFSGEAVEKPLRVLSGGERTRFRLAQLLFSPANLLLLDEPTNHLDITSRATVEKALQSYSGTVIVVSHDRVFMERVTNKIIEIDNGRVNVFPGNYHEYLIYKENQISGSDGRPAKLRDANAPAGTARDEPPAAGGASAKSAAAPPAEPDRPIHEQRVLTRDERKALSRQKRALRKGIEEAEAEIEKIENRAQQIDQDMANPAIAVDFAKLAPLTKERENLMARHDEILARWETMSAELEILEKTGDDEG